MTNRTNDCRDCRHYKKDADDKVYCNFYNTSVSKCKIQYCGIFSPRDIYIVDGVEMNAKEYIRHLESENERLQQELESMPVIESGDTINLKVSLFNSQKSTVIADTVKKHYEKVYECIEVCELLEEMADNNCKLSKPCGHWKIHNHDYVIYIASVYQEKLIEVLRIAKIKRWLP